MASLCLSYMYRVEVPELLVMLLHQGRACHGGLPATAEGLCWTAMADMDLDLA